MRTDVLRLPRPKRREETRSFVDPVAPDVEITMTMRAPDVPTRVYAQELAAHYEAQWLAENGPRYTHVDGEPVELSSRLLLSIALLECMQTGQPEDKYGLVELIGIMVSLPNVWNQLDGWAGELIIHGIEHAEKN